MAMATKKAEEYKITTNRDPYQFLINLGYAIDHQSSSLAYVIPSTNKRVIDSKAVSIAQIERKHENDEYSITTTNKDLAEKIKTEFDPVYRKTEKPKRIIDF